MGDSKDHVLSLKLSDEDFILLNKLIEKTQEEVSMRVTKPNMFKKLIWEEAERRGLK